MKKITVTAEIMIFIAKADIMILKVKIFFNPIVRVSIYNYWLYKKTRLKG